MGIKAIGSFKKTKSIFVENKYILKLADWLINKIMVFGERKYKKPLLGSLSSDDKEFFLAWVELYYAGEKNSESSYLKKQRS